LAAAVVFLIAAPALALTGNGWISPGEAGTDSSDALEKFSVNGRTNLCEGINGIPFGSDPGWAKVGGDPNPFVPFATLEGQVLPDLAHATVKTEDDRYKTNPLITSTDNTFNHYMRDMNVFVTLDPSSRWALADGNFALEADGGESEENEIGLLEAEWERGAVPPWARPASYDRIVLFGWHVFDCGHGNPDRYRTEIHSPVGWVSLRNTANSHDWDQDPGAKKSEDPWVWYEAGDHQGMGETFPDTGLLDTPVQSTVADAFFSSFGGNIPESVNGCDDDTFISDDTVNAQCFDDEFVPNSWEWWQPLLKEDYTFFVPAPPRPSPGTQLVWSSVDNCSATPPNPGNPGDDVEGAGEADPGETAYNIGNATCNIPDHVEVTNGPFDYGITVTVRAHSGADGIVGTGDDPTYPSNNYVAFGKRYKVAWDYVPTGAGRVKTFNVHFDTLRVYDDAEPCIEDGEWAMSIFVNEQWRHPVDGHGDSDTPFWSDGAVDDDKCIIGHDPTYQPYDIGELFTVNVVPGEQIFVREKSYDVDFISNDDTNPVVYAFRSAPGTYVDGVSDTDVEGAHTIVYTISDVTKPQAPACCITIGDPQYGPNPDTNGLIRVNGTDAHETPITVSHPDADGLEWRFTKSGDLLPGTWNFDFDASDGLRIDLPNASSASGTYTIEWATVRTTDGLRIVSPRESFQVQLDNTPPTLDLPDPITVNADQTAGKVVDYVVTALDNFPGPIDISCVPPSGSLFPNGKNAPLTTTVNCSATDSVENTSTGSFTVTVVSPFGYIPDFVVLGIDWATVGSGTIVNGTSANLANVGAFDQSAGVPNQDGFEIVVGPSAVFLGGSQIAAHSDRVENSTIAGDVFYVDQYFGGNGALFTPKVGYVPLWFNMPTVPSFSAGGADQSLSGTTSLGPGTYGKLALKPNAVVTLSGGTYNFTSVEVKAGAKLRAAAATTIRVVGRVLVSNGGEFGPAPGSAVQPHDVVLYSTGVDGPPNKPAQAIEFGTYSIVGINAYAPNGTLTIGSHAVGTGAFLGKRVAVGGSVTLAEDSVFVQP
jgi:hypothetical protein